MKFNGELGCGLQRPTDLITFSWRSPSLSGSGSPFRITIWIREELPQFWRSAEICALWVLLVRDKTCTIHSFLRFHCVCVVSTLLRWLKDDHNVQKTWRIDWIQVDHHLRSDHACNERTRWSNKLQKYRLQNDCDTATGGRRVAAIAFQLLVDNWTSNERGN